jgi:hypothetical protein
MNDQWRRIINGSIRVYDASAQTLAKERGQSAPRLTRYLLGDAVVVEGLSLDPDLALAAVNGRLDGDRGPVLWVDHCRRDGASAQPSDARQAQTQP